MVKCAIFDIVDNVSPGISWLASLDLLVSRRTKTYFMLAPWMSGIYFYSFSSFILMSGSFFQYFFLEMSGISYFAGTLVRFTILTKCIGFFIVEQSSDLLRLYVIKISIESLLFSGHR